MDRSFTRHEPHPQPAFVARPPVGEEGAAYARVRRYLWSDEPEGPAAEGRPPESAPPASTRP